MITKSSRLDVNTRAGVVLSMKKNRLTGAELERNTHERSLALHQVVAAAKNVKHDPGVKEEKRRAVAFALRSGFTLAELASIINKPRSTIHYWAHYKSEGA